MLWRLSRPVHSFLVSAPAYRRCNSTAAATVPPLRILFCGSDDFSVASLRALTRAQKQEPSLIESIEVVHRPAKRFGRGLKQLREGCTVHQRMRQMLIGSSPNSSSGCGGITRHLRRRRLHGLGAAVAVPPHRRRLVRPLHPAARLV